MPLIALFASFSDSNPNFVGIRRRLMPRPVPVVYHHIGLLIIGFFTWIGLLVLFAGFGTGIIITGYGIAVVHGWTLFLKPDRYDGKLRGGLCFEQGIKMYKSLSIMCKIHSELARELITTCMHHCYIVIYCSFGLWALLKQTVDKEGISIIIAVGSSTIFGMLFLFEWFVVNFITKGATGSKEFLYRVQKYNEKNKYRRKVVRAILPNSINLEVITSVDTIKDGIQRNYFINFVSRVTDVTIRLLLAKSTTDIF